MPFYRFHVWDAMSRVDGPGHDGAALDDDIDATLFAAGVAQRLSQLHPDACRRWTIEIMRDNRRVGMLPVDKACQVMLRPDWVGHPDYEPEPNWA